MLFLEILYIFCEIFYVRTTNSIRHTGSKTEAGKNLTDKVQNIYDLEGNFTEYVAEKNNASGPFVERGRLLSLLQLLQS